MLPPDVPFPLGEVEGSEGGVGSVGSVGDVDELLRVWDVELLELEVVRVTVTVHDGASVGLLSVVLVVVGKGPVPEIVLAPVTVEVN